MYREMVAPPRFAAIVEAVWVREEAAPALIAVPAELAPAHRILPDGCTDLIWVDGELTVAGPDTRAQLTASRPGARYTAVRFHPGAGPAVLGVPGQELRNGRVPLAQLCPAGYARRLADRVTAADERPTALLRVLAELLADTDPPDPVTRAVAGVLGRAGHPSVAATAAAVGFSERQLHRRCLDAFGYGPQMLSRILRLRRAVVLARAGTPFAEVAASTGYADQPHLAREVRALAGVPLGDLVADAPRCAGLSGVELTSTLAAPAQATWTTSPGRRRVFEDEKA